MASDAATQAALQWVSEFNARWGGGVWRYVERAALAKSLADRVTNPDLIDQNATEFCGPSAVIRSWAADDPVGYVRLGIGLWEVGFGHFMRNADIGGQLVKPSTDLLNSPLPFQTYKDGTRNPMDPADWVIAASIRESFNLICHITSKSGMLAAGTRPDEVKSMFHKLGYREAVNNANWYFCKDAEHLQLANDFLKYKYHVCVFVNGDVLYKEKQEGHDSFFSRTFSKPNHWIMLQTPFVFHGSPKNDSTIVTANVWTWGSLRQIAEDPASKPMKVESLVHNYYGFVAARF